MVTYGQTRLSRPTKVKPLDVPAIAARRAAARAELIRAAWLKGDLEYVLHADQRRVRALIRRAFSGSARRFVLEIARRWGKSILLVVLCCEEAIRNPGVRIVYGAPTLKMLGEFVHPAFALVTLDAPDDLKPVWTEKDQHYTFPNGSWIHLFGADDERAAARGRGGNAHMVVFDEAAFTSVLPFVMTHVFGPALQLTRGPSLVSSSPADRPDHDFTAIAELEEAAGNYVNRSWLDNPLLTDERRLEEIEENARQSGMTVDEYVKSPGYLREYMGKRIVDPLLVGVPEWAAVADECTVAIERPKLFRGHTSIDFGGNDPHFAIAGYWHLEHGLVIEHEVMQRNDEVHVQLLDAIKAMEREAWGVDTFDGTLAALADASLVARFGDRLPAWMKAKDHKRARAQPYLRVADHDMELIRIFYESGFAVLPAQKQDKELRIQRLRALVREKKLKVHPRCVHTLRHLRQTTWKNHERREWARKGGEHGDGIDCLSYMLMDLNREVPLEPGTKSPAATTNLSQTLLGDSPLARKLLARRLLGR